MDYSEIKKHFYSSVIAVVVGVALLGVNSAFGALAEPGEEPANATLHSPVFNGVDVKGNIVNSGAANDGAVVINDDVGIQNNLVVGQDALVANNFQAAGKITVGSGIGGGSLIVRKDISNDTVDAIGSPVKVNDKLQVTGNTSLEGNVDVQRKVENNRVLNNGIAGFGYHNNTFPVTIQDELSILYDVVFTGGDINLLAGDFNIKQGKIYNKDGDFVNIGDHTRIDGRLETLNGYGISSAGDVLANRDLSAQRDALVERNVDVHGYITNSNAVDFGGGYDEFVPVEINDAQGLVVNGNRIVLDGDNGYLMIESNAISNPEGDLILQKTWGADVKVGTNGFPNDLIVAGKITGSTIGTFDKKTSGVLSVAGVVGTQKIFSTPACDAEEIVLDCGIKSYIDAGGGSLDSDAFNITKLDADFATRKCNITVTKNLAAERWVEGFATCFNPKS